MNRRCTGNTCLIEADKKSRIYNLDSPVATILLSPKKEWDILSFGKNRFANRKISVDWKKYTQDDYLFVHSTIVSSVATSPNGYYVDPVCEGLINNNGNGWTTPIINATFRSFVGKPNYFEHIQIPSLSKGILLDAVARPVVYKNEAGKTADVVYIDLLVAVDRKHGMIVNQINSGELNGMSMGCGLAGTSITMSDGSFKSIEDICVGDEVLSHLGNSRNVTSLFEFECKDSPLYNLNCSGGHNVRLTGEHPVLIAKKDSIRCKYDSICNIEEDQNKCFYSNTIPIYGGKRRPCGRNKIEYEYDMEFVPIGEIKKGHYVAESFPVKIKDDDSLNEKLCRLLGLYTGDGYCLWNYKNKEKTTSYGMEFCFGTHENHLLEEVKELINELYPDTRITIKIVKERNGLYVRIHSKEFANICLNHCGEYASEKKFSETLMLLPKEKQLCLLSGLYDTDGCYYKRKNTMHLITSSKILANQVHLMLLRNRIGNRFSECKRVATGFKKGADPYIQYDVYIGKKYTPLLKCKKNLSYGQKQKVVSDECLFYKNYYLVPIKNVSVININAKVYNFSVEEDESYLVDGIAVHNCVANWVTCSKCGGQFSDSMKSCKHIEHELLDYFVDEKGVRRIVAELCGRMIKNQTTGELEADPESNEFIEASWVGNPAFEGAVINHYITDSKVAKILNMSDHRLENVVDDIFKIRVADTQGMLVLRVAWEELRRRKYNSMLERVSRG